MDGTQIIDRTHNFHAPPRVASPPQALYKVQMLAASTFLAYGICSTCIGIPKLVQAFSRINVKITGAIDTSNFSFKEKIYFEINREEVYTNSMLAITGVLSIALSAGILCGMVRNYR